jgi:hypothetical protein
MKPKRLKSDDLEPRIVAQAALLLLAVFSLIMLAAIRNLLG